MSQLFRKLDENRLVHYEGIFLEVLERLGEMPLPPYIKEKLKEFDMSTGEANYKKRKGFMDKVKDFFND